MQAVRLGAISSASRRPTTSWDTGSNQFSPELFYPVFSPPNGFVVERLVIVEDHWRSPWYEVRDPIAVGRRESRWSIDCPHIFSS